MLNRLNHIFVPYFIKLKFKQQTVRSIKMPYTLYMSRFPKMISYMCCCRHIKYIIFSKSKWILHGNVPPGKIMPMPHVITNDDPRVYSVALFAFVIVFTDSQGSNPSISYIQAKWGSRRLVYWEAMAKWAKANSTVSIMPKSQSISLPELIVPRLIDIHVPSETWYFDMEDIFIKVS